MGDELASAMIKDVEENINDIVNKGVREYFNLFLGDLLMLFDFMCFFYFR